SRRSTSRRRARSRSWAGSRCSARSARRCPRDRRALPGAGRVVRRPRGRARRVRPAHAVRLARARDEHQAARLPAAERAVRLAPHARLDGPVDARPARRRAAARPDAPLRHRVRARAVRVPVAAGRGRRRRRRGLAHARSGRLVPAAEVDRAEGLAPAPLRELRRLRALARPRADGRERPQGRPGVRAGGARRRAGALARSLPDPRPAGRPCPSVRLRRIPDGGYGFPRIRPGAHAPSLRIVKVLIVEDEDSIAEPLAEGLRREGFAVERVGTGRAALESSEPDLVLLDLALPDLDGFSVCRELRSRSNVPIIMVSAKGEEVDRVVGLELGADDYIVKPFGFRELLARIRAVTRRTSERAPTRATRVGTL